MPGRTAEESIVAYQEQNASDGDPIMELTRKLGVTGGGDSPSVTVNIAAEARDITGFPDPENATGTEVQIEIYHDRYVVFPPDQ